MSTKREAILEAAIKLFSEKGFKSSSTAEISALTGVAEGTVFYHFKTKEDLLLNILEKIKSEIIEEFNQFLANRKAASGLEGVEEAICFYLYLAGKMDDRFLLLHRRYLYELAQTNPTCREYLMGIYECLIDIFEHAINEGQADGSISPSPARKTALILFSMVDGLVRFRNYHLYDAGALYAELISACRRMLKSP